MAARRSKSRRRPPVQVRTIVLCALVVALAVAAAVWVVRRAPSGPDSPIEQRLVELAAERGVRSGDVVADEEIRKVDGVFVRTWRLGFPSADAREGFIGELELEAAQRHAALTLPGELSGPEIAARLDFGSEAFDLRLQLREQRAEREVPTPAPTPIPTATPRPQPAADARGRLAILLDDAGQSFDLVPTVMELPDEVGVAVLPFLPKSSETASAVHKAGHEVWVHLPMEPQNYPANDPGPGAVLVSMDTDTIRTTVHSAINSVPYAVGVNNHMGSRATADLKTMTWIMQELSARGLAFIDSRTTTATVAEKAAQAQGVPVARRHVFLDNQRNPAAVRRQLEEAVYTARLRGEAIAIGHVDEVTLEVLAAELPGLAARGADLVRPSDLVR